MTSRRLAFDTPVARVRLTWISNQYLANNHISLYPTWSQPSARPHYTPIMRLLEQHWNSEFVTSMNLLYIIHSPSDLPPSAQFESSSTQSTDSLRGERNISTEPFMSTGKFRILLRKSITYWGDRINGRNSIISFSAQCNTGWPTKVGQVVSIIISMTCQCHCIKQVYTRRHVAVILREVVNIAKAN